jgi:CSLREA domain-containing protein
MLGSFRFHARRASVALLASLLALSVGVLNGALSTPAAAATFARYTVNSTNDATGGSLCTTQPPTAQVPCTLRAAVAAANGGSGVEIDVNPGVYTLTGGALALSKPMTIIGARQQPGAAATTIDGGAKDRVFNVSANVTIDGVVVRNGAAAKNANGGGILVNKSWTLLLTKSTVANNTASQGAGIEVDGTATVDQSTLTGNTASGKGGGVFAAGTTTIQNSTFDGNSASGGGGIAGSATTTVLASTIVNNNSNNSNGGGLYRVGGTFSIAGTILAANNASTGRDCYGSPSFTGTNILQYTPGCNPSGGTILVLDPQVGALGDNGGPTQTRRPLPGSAAIDAYAIPCAGGLAVDQRGIARPQPAGGKCDVGAVEIAPIGLDLSLASSSETIGAGVGTVPEANVTPAAVVPPGTPAGSVQGTFGKFTFGKFTFGKFTFGKFTFGKFTFGKFTFGKFTFGKFTFGKFTFGKFTFGKFTNDAAILTSAGLANPLTSIHVSDLTMNRPGGWDALLKGTQFENVPREQITFADVMPLLESAGLSLNDVDITGTSLGSLPMGSILLAGIPMKYIPLNAGLESATDQQRLDAWCAAIDNPNQHPCTALNVGPGSSIDPLAISLAGFSLDGVDLTQILAKDVAPNGNDPFASMPLITWGHAQTPLASIPVSSLPAAWVNCSAFTAPVTCANATLADAANTDTLPNPAINPSITLYDLFTNPATVTLPTVAAFTIADLLSGLVPPQAFPWQNVDLSKTSLQNSASPLEPALTYTATLNLRGDRAANTSVKITLPAGFVYVPNTFKIDGVAASTDATVNGAVVTMPLGTLTPGAHTATINARAGLTLGAATASAQGCANVGASCDPATASAGPDTAVASAQKTVTVTESFEHGGTPGCGDFDPCDTKTLLPDTLYIGHISTPTDEDLYTFSVPSTGKTRASIILSNIAPGADFDLVLYGPKPPSIGARPPLEAFQPVNDGALSLYSSDIHLAPDTVGDIPLTPPAGMDVLQVSANRLNTDEQIDTGTLPPGNYAVQVSGYNGSTSPQPYLLRMAMVGVAPSPCVAPTHTFADGGALAATTTVGPNPHVLFVVPQHRLYQTYGAARVDPVIAKVQTLAQNVGGTILAIDNPNGDPGQTAADEYAAWDANHCDPAAANAVVHQISVLIDQARQANPQIDSVVLVGDDSVLPMGRVPDRVGLGNEASYSDALQSLVPAPGGTQLEDNELSGSMGDGYMLSDNVYGTQRGSLVNDHELFVPDVAVGRLVETPEDIATAIQTYLDNSGTLDPTTATSALVTGYDFMNDTADAVATQLNNNGQRNVTELKGAWGPSDLTTPLLGGTAPGITSFNGHFDQTRLVTGNQTDNVPSSVLASPANAGKLSRRLLFSMGCHSGLSVSDVSVGTELDWPQAITGTGQGGLYEGNTGYGYGDTDAVALGERLMALYAEALNGASNVGQALMLAKQEYAATTEVLNPFDEKVLQESTFYGLPLYKLSAPLPGSNGTIQVLQMAASSSGPATSISGTDPRTLLDVAPLSDSSAATLKHTGDGDYYEVNGQKIMVQNRPIEPMNSFDVTQPNHRAHGFLVTSLTSNDESNFTPKYFRPVVDNSATEQQVAPIADSIFPATLSRVTHSVNGNGAKDTVLLTRGQARDPQPNGMVTQRHLDVGGLVEYSTVADTDFLAPTILRSRGEIVGTTAGFTVDTTADAARVFVLYKPVGANGKWSGVDLVPTNTAGGKSWWGGGPISADSAEFFVQAVDASGNVASSNNKVLNFLASRLNNNGALSISLQTPAGVTKTNGWYNGGPVTATISGGTGITFSLDGADFAAYPANGVLVPPAGVPVDGVHHLLAQDDAGDHAVVDVLIDSHAPAVSDTIDPGSNTPKSDSSNQTWYPGPVTLHIDANDGVAGSGVASIAYHAGNNADTVVTDASNPALVHSPLGDASTDVTVNSSATYSYNATDMAGNTSGTQSETIRIDTAPPVVNCTVPPNAPWYNTDVTVTCHSTDAGIGLKSSADTDFALQTNVPQGTQTSTAQIAAYSVCDLFNQCTTVGPFVFKVDEQAPTITGTIQPGARTSAQDGAKNVWYNGSVNLHLAGDDGSDGSGIASITYASSGALTLPTTTVNGATADVNVNPASDGTSNLTYTARDVANNPSAQGNTGVNIDTTPPTFSCSPPPTAPWYQGDVTVNCNASDAGVGLAVTSPSVFSLVAHVDPGVQSATVNTPSQQLCDRLAHCVTAGPYTYKIDRKVPTVTITTPANLATYNAGQIVAAQYMCDDGSGSGVSSCVGTVLNGANIDTTTGTHVFTVTGTDAAGNVAVAQATYAVGYNICYQYDTTTPQSRGGTVVIKLQLCDGAGHNLSSPNITLTAVAQDFPGPNPPRQLPQPNFQGSSNNGFDFRYTGGSYTYNLDPTQPPPNGLASGPHTLYFVVNHSEPPLYTAPFVLK